MKRLMILLSLLCLNSYAAPIQGRETGNGGDPVAIEFISSAQDAIAFVHSHQQDYPALALVDLDSILANAEVLVVDDPLPVKKDALVQNSVAMNSHNPDRVTIYRKGWNDTPSKEIRQALTLHEVVSLAGLEETGVYNVVQKFIADLYRTEAQAKAEQDAADAKAKAAAERRARLPVCGIAEGSLVVVRSGSPAELFMVTWNGNAIQTFTDYTSAYSYAMSLINSGQCRGGE